MTNVNISDWICFALAIIGTLATVLSQRDRLPSSVRVYLKKINTSEIMEAIEKVQAMKTMTSSERREAVVTYIRKLCVEKTGVTIPKSIANLMVEYVYQQWKGLKS